MMQEEVVAEGVETVHQESLPHDLNCDFGQGYYFAKPLPVEKIIQHLNAPNSFSFLFAQLEN